MTEYAIWILFYIMMAQMVIIMVPRALVCIERMAEVLSLEPEIQDKLPVPAETEIVKPDPHTSEALDFGGAASSHALLSFDDVTFRFPDADENTLSHLAFQGEKGTTTAIIGGTGSGKSTIAKLILRFHDVTSGRICLDGTDIRELPQKKPVSYTHLDVYKRQVPVRIRLSPLSVMYRPALSRAVPRRQPAFFPDTDSRKQLQTGLPE